MFHAVYSNPVTSLAASNGMIATHRPLQPQLPNSLDSQVMRGCPVSLDDGRTLMYYVPAKNEVSLQQASYFRTEGHRWPPVAAANTAQRAAETHSTVCFAPCVSTATRRSDGSRVLIQQTLGASTTNFTLLNRGSGTATRTAATTNGSTAPTGASVVLPSFQMSRSCPTGAMTAVDAWPHQPQTCFWLSHATGALTPIRKEDMMTISDTGASTSTHSYPMQPPPLMPSQSQSTSEASVPSYLVASQLSSFDEVMTPAFSESLSLSKAFAVPALPLPQPPRLRKTLNGLQYQLGELYEGFVKRYNPNRGFGFLTATMHIKIGGDGSSSGSAAGTPTASLNAAGAAVPAAGEADAPKRYCTPVHLGDIFVHQSSMQMEGFRTLPVGGRVRFRIGYKDGQQTLQAVDVELLPQVLPPNAEMALPVSVALAEKTDKVVSLPPAAPSPRFVGGSSTNGQLFQGSTLSLTFEDYGNQDDDEPLIELAYNTYAGLD